MVARASPSSTLGLLLLSLALLVTPMPAAPVGEGDNEGPRPGDQIDVNVTASVPVLVSCNSSTELNSVNVSWRGPLRYKSSPMNDSPSWEFAAEAARATVTAGGNC